jgi:hypothetical protein
MKRKSFFKMTDEERTAYASRFDKPVPASAMRPLSAKGKLLWKAARRGRPAKSPEERRARVLLSIDPALLQRTDIAAQKQGLSRARFASKCLETVLKRAG